MSGFLLGGSRSLPVALPAPASAWAQSVVASVWSAWRPSEFVCGCCVGADELFFSAVVSLGYPVRLFAAPSGVPRSGWSCVSRRSLALAARVGVPVVWGAPGVPVAAAFAARSRAAAAASSAALLLLSSLPSRGSFVSASALLGRGCPVWFVSPFVSSAFPFAVVPVASSPGLCVVRPASQSLLF